MRNRHFCTVVALSVFSAGEWTAANAARMDYHDADELAAALTALASNSRHARLFRIGDSPNYKGRDPRSPERKPIYAIRIAASTDETIEDDYRKNSILFEAGSHPREWLTTESSFKLAEYLIVHAEDRSTEVPDLLRNVDVWIIPLTNAAGRVIDDEHAGDPDQYYSTNDVQAGWRGDGDTRDCVYGINVARNFSSGWQNASSTCSGDQKLNYRGPSPFFSEEARALRSFVQNHGISMAVVVHSNSQKIWNLWANRNDPFNGPDPAGTAIALLAGAAWARNLDDQRLALTYSPVGSGVGQFSAWLSSVSSTPGEPDEGTRRGFQTILIELPFLAENYGRLYRDRDNDASNGFHPSGGRVRDLIDRNFIPMATSLIRSAVSPGCVPGYGGLNRDFGLVGAKIGSTPFGPGQIESYSAERVNGALRPARDYLIVGTYGLRYRVQNFSFDARNHDIDVKLTVDNGRTVVTQTRSFRALAPLETATGRFDINIDQAGLDYTVKLELLPAGGSDPNRADDLALNNSKVFQFRSYLF